MIIKEYRVVMPVSVEEYQVAQLYMVAKLSAQQTGDFTFDVAFTISFHFYLYQSLSLCSF